jgi:hypothetical protein
MKLKQFLIEKEFPHDFTLREKDLENGEMKEIPNLSNVGTVNGMFKMEEGSRLRLKNLNNFPKVVRGRMNISHCPNLETLAGPLIEVQSDFLFIDCLMITSLEGIGRKYIRQLEKAIFPTHSLTSHVLGILMIKNVESVDPLGMGKEPFRTMVKIMNEHLAGERDVMDAHEDLTRAGLKEYAKL